MNIQQKCAFCAVMFWFTTQFTTFVPWKLRKVWAAFSASKTNCYGISARRKPSPRKRNVHCQNHWLLTLKWLTLNQIVSRFWFKQKKLNILTMQRQFRLVDWIFDTFRSEKAANRWMWNGSDKWACWNHHIDSKHHTGRHAIGFAKIFRTSYQLPTKSMATQHSATTSSIWSCNRLDQQSGTFAAKTIAAESKTKSKTVDFVLSNGQKFLWKYDEEAEIRWQHWIGTGRNNKSHGVASFLFHFGHVSGILKRKKLPHPDR